MTTSPKQTRTPGKWEAIEGSIRTMVNGISVQLATISRTQFCGEKTLEEIEVQRIINASRDSDAEFICKAVNLHDELVEALKTAHAYYRNEDGLDAEQMAIWGKVYAAIQKAEGGE